MIPLLAIEQNNKYWKTFLNEQTIVQTIFITLGRWSRLLPL